MLCSLRASSPIWANEASLARTCERGPRKGELATMISHKLSFPPRKPRTPQNVKTVTANVAQIRKVTTACQVSLESRGRVEFFIYKSLSQQHQSNVFNHWYVFFPRGHSLGTRGFSCVQRKFSVLAEGPHIFGRRHIFARLTIKTWQKPETALERSLAPRVRPGTARIRTHYFESRFVYFLKVVHTTV